MSGKVKICTSIIAREEEHVIERCLNNLSPYTDAIAVCVNGPTWQNDKTITLINRYMREKGIPGEVIATTWKDFGTNRTEALRHSEDVVYRIERGMLGPAGSDPKQDGEGPVEEGPVSFDEEEKPSRSTRFESTPDASPQYSGDSFLASRLKRNKPADLKNKWYFMFMDVDNQVFPNEDEETDPKDKGIFSFDKSKLDADSYMIDMKMANSVYGYTWMVQCNPERRWSWRGVLHEFVGVVDKKATTRGKIKGGYILSSREGARNKNPVKYYNDAIVFKKTIPTTTDDLLTRYWFYMAQSWRDAGEHRLARDAYLKRAEMGGWEEEVYFSWYEAGKLSIKIEARKNKHLIYFFKACEIKRSRWEAAFRIIEFFRMNNMFKEGWNFAKDRLEENWQENYLFVEHDIHEWRFKDSASICAWYAGAKHQWDKLTKEILKVKSLPASDRARILKDRNTFKL
jgi:hypothetical protein